jgi:hypothetical protein
MSPHRAVLIVSLLALVLPAAAQQPAPTPPAPAANPGEAILDRAVSNLRSLGWVETDFKQQMSTQGVRFEASGRYLIPPDGEWKVLYQLDLRLGDVRTVHKIVSDGGTVWRIVRVQDLTTQETVQNEVVRYPVDGLRTALDEVKRSDLGDQKTEQIWRDVVGEHGFSGLQPLLRDLRDRLTFTRVEPAELPGVGPVTLLEGEWNKATLDLIAPDRKVDSAAGPSLREQWDKRQARYTYWPRKCRLFLGPVGGFWPWAAPLWPYRVEWLGPTKAGGADELLVALEFSRPVPKTAAEAANELTVADEEKKLAKDYDPASFVKRRQERLAQAKRFEDELLKLKPFDPTPLVPPKP